jgi:hypothetical protein
MAIVRTAARDAWRALRWVMLDTAPDPLELMLAVIALGWGLVLLTPTATLVDTPAYRPLLLLMGEMLWAVAFLAVAALGIVGVLAERVWLRLGALTGHVFVWTALAVAIVLTTPATPGWWVYGVFAVRAGWAMRQVAVRSGRR